MYIHAQAVEQNHNQELLVIPGYQGLTSWDKLDGSENSMFSYTDVDVFSHFLNKN